MTEKLLHFIWKFKLFTSTALQTTDGLPVKIIHVGTHNTHAGPDFLEAKIEIEGTLWVGHIELHIKTSDWIKHKHSQDLKYDNTILHVVYEHNAEVPHLHTLALKPFIDNSLLNRYSHLMSTGQAIPCIENLRDIREIVLQQQIDKMLVQRLMDKASYITNLLERHANNWQEVFYITLSRAFGLHINQDCFEAVAANTPLHILSKHKNSIMQLEALLFGQAGLLNDYFHEDYPQTLQREYAYLQKLYKLEPIEKHQWKFLRLRPANFPTLRLAQFAQIIHQSTHLLSKLLEAENLKAIESLFKINTTSYWEAHYTFHDTSEAKNKPLGKSFIHTIIINVLSPLLFVYGKHQAKEIMCERAFSILKEIKAEKNALLAPWNTTPLKPDTAYESQALIQLTKNYCHPKKCLECSIGYTILRG